MYYVYAVKLLSGFFGNGLAFFGENMLATLSSGIGTQLLLNSRSLSNIKEKQVGPHGNFETSLFTFYNCITSAVCQKQSFPNKESDMKTLQSKICKITST